MSEDRRSILQMLAEGKVTADEAERLISALERPPANALPGSGPAPAGHNKAAPKYLRVAVDTEEGHGGPTMSMCGCPCNCCGPGCGYPASSRRTRATR